jgi:SAM-dependent methyltransferase
MPPIEEITSNLERRDNGIWVARSQREVSYPEAGNDACFAVEDNSFWFRHRNEVITALVTRISRSATFFDIGGGNGCVSYALQSAGIEVVLVEPGPRGAQNAMGRGVRTVVQSTLEDAGFAPRSLPSAGLFDVVEHIDNDAEFLSLIHNYLQPNGTLYLTVPAYNFLWSNDDVNAGHFRRYTVPALSRLLTACGFRIEYSSYLFSFLVPPMFCLRTVPTWIGYRKSVSQTTNQKEHSAGGSMARGVIQWILSAELKRITGGKRIPFGTSCLAVARRMQ